MIAKVRLSPSKAKSLNLPEEIEINDAMYDKEYAGHVKVRVHNPPLNGSRWISIIFLTQVPIKGINKLRKEMKK